jgi:hypothetical protein
VSDPISLQDLCSRYHLDLLEVKRWSPHGSFFVAHVRNQNDEHFVLKRTPPTFRPREVTVMRAWQHTRQAARFVAEVESGAYMAEWLVGKPFVDVVLDRTIDDVVLGAMVLGLHQAAVADMSPLPGVRDRFAPGTITEGGLLAPMMIAFGESIAARLSAYEPPRDVVLHGDLVPSNVILTSDGPKVFDPVGYRGLPAWDLAQLAVSAHGRGRDHVLWGLLTGYGHEPPLIAEMFAWHVLFYLQKSLAAQNKAFARNLQPLATAIVDIGDCRRFLTQYRSRR